MDWTDVVDAYCERTAPGLVEEPLNAVSNLAFLIAAAWMWRRTAGDPMGRVLAAVLFGIGIASAAWHTLAQVWTGAADSLTILVFVILYLWCANRDFWGMPYWAAALGTAAYVPYTMLLTPVFDALPFFGISGYYWPLPVLIGGYAWALRKRHPGTARGLALGAGLLCVSLTARSLDDAVCTALPVGTHALWHILNAVMLGWMIEVRRRHVAAGRAGGSAGRA